MPPISKLLVATDLGEHSEVLFAQALKLSLVLGAELQVMHVEPGGGEVAWSALPTVRSMLVQWGELSPDASLEDFTRLGVKVSLESVFEEEPVAGVSKGIRALEPDLLVLGTRGRQGLQRMIEGSVAEQIARRAGLATLFVPHNAQPLVDVTDGSLRLRHILLPLAPGDAQAALDAAVDVLDQLSQGHLRVTLTHIGSPRTMPEVRLPLRERWSWETDFRSGSVTDGILTAARDHHAHLIVMATRGQDSLLDVVAGSTTERVVRSALCPVLALPVR